MTDDVIRRCIECDELIHGDDWRLDGILYVHPELFKRRAAMAVTDQN